LPPGTAGPQTAYRQEALFSIACKMPLTAVAVYGLEVPAGDVLIPAAPEFPATVSFPQFVSADICIDMLCLLVIVRKLASCDPAALPPMSA